MYKYELAKFMDHVKKRNSNYTLMDFFDNAKNDLNLNTRSRIQEKLKDSLSQELKKNY